jgi:hypothetical protein
MVEDTLGSLASGVCQISMAFTERGILTDEVSNRNSAHQLRIRLNEQR